MSARDYCVQYGDATIPYDITFAQRKTVGISVDPDLRVSVTAPVDASPDAVAARVRKRAPWILRQQRELEQYVPALPPRLYVSGETHLFLGRQYRLKVLDGLEERVTLARGYLHIVVPDKTDTTRIKKLVDDWYAVQANRVFRVRLRHLLPRFHHLGIVEPPVVVIKRLTARWGSCTSTGAITLNVALIQARTSYIDYVIVHELCHIVEHNHSKKFYMHLDRVMPNWRTYRRHLNELRIC